MFDGATIAVNTFEITFVSNVILNGIRVLNSLSRNAVFYVVIDKKREQVSDFIQWVFQKTSPRNVVSKTG